jgi:dienelactone hydrolase
MVGQAAGQDRRNTFVPNTDTHFVMPEYRTPAEWDARRARLQKQILWAAGLMPLPEKTPLNAQVFGRLERKGYSIEKVLIETMPGYFLAGSLYRPLGRPGKHPAVLTPHGHWTYGRLEHTPNFSGPLLGINLARQGYVSFAYDMVGWNDTVQTPHAFGTPREHLWSFGPLGLQLWNSIRAVDFVHSLQDVDPERIAVTGASGGGTQAFLLAAVDSRIAAAAPVNMVSAIMQGGSPCENAPGLRVDAFNVEIACVFAPKPMLLVAATGDWTKNVPREEYPAIRRIYGFSGKADSVEAVQFEAGHNYNQAGREAVYRFFGKHLLGETDAAKLAEQDAEVEKIQDMLALHNRRLPGSALSFEALVEQWRAAARRQIDTTTSLDSLRELLSLSLAAEWPRQVTSLREGQRLVLGRPGKGDRVPALWSPGSEPAALLVHEEGAEAARKSWEGRRLITAKRAFLAIDAFQTGAAVEPRDRSHEFFLTFNRSDDANRVQDILTALAYLRARPAGRIELIGSGKAAVWSLFAAAVSPLAEAPADLKLVADFKDFVGTDDDFLGKFFVPGIQRAGGMKTALLLTDKVR